MKPYQIQYINDKVNLLYAQGKAVNTSQADFVLKIFEELSPSHEMAFAAVPQVIENCSMIPVENQESMYELWEKLRPVAIHMETHLLMAADLAQMHGNVIRELGLIIEGVITSADQSKIGIVQHFIRSFNANTRFCDNFNQAFKTLSYIPEYLSILPYTAQVPPFYQKSFIDIVKFIYEHNEDTGEGNRLEVYDALLIINYSAYPLLERFFYCNPSFFESVNLRNFLNYCKSRNEYPLSEHEQYMVDNLKALMDNRNN